MMGKEGEAEDQGVRTFSKKKVTTFLFHIGLQTDWKKAAVGSS